MAFKRTILPCIAEWSPGDDFSPDDRLIITLIGGDWIVAKWSNNNPKGCGYLELDLAATSSSFVDILTGTFPGPRDDVTFSVPLHDVWSGARAAPCLMYRVFARGSDWHVMWGCEIEVMHGIQSIDLATAAVTVSNYVPSSYTKKLLDLT